MRTPKLLSKDLIAGLLFAAIGLAFLMYGKDYRFGTSRQMGPGYFPLVLSGLLLVLGLAVCFKGLLAPERIQAVGLKGLILVPLATFLFGVLVRPAGMLIAIFVITFVGAMASANFRLIPGLLLAVGLSAFCWVVFSKMLGMPFPVVGYWFR